MFRTSRKEENRTLEFLLKAFLVVGIVAGICVIAKVLYDKYKQRLCLLCDDDADCDFECLENDDLDCDCDNCQYVKHDDAEAAEEASSGEKEAASEEA